MLIGFHIWALKLGNQCETIIIGSTVSDVRSCPIFNFWKSDVKFDVGYAWSLTASLPLENDDPASFLDPAYFQGRAVQLPGSNCVYVCFFPRFGISLKFSGHMLTTPDGRPCDSRMINGKKNVCKAWRSAANIWTVQLSSILVTSADPVIIMYIFRL